MAEPEQAKILIETGEDVETLWAERLGGNLFQLDNSPFFAYGVSWRDIVEAIPITEETFRFVRVIQKSGYRTVRIAFDICADESPANMKILKEITELGASYEGAFGIIIAIDIPPEMDMQVVTDYLIAKEVEWEHADPTYDELYGDS